MNNKSLSLPPDQLKRLCQFFEILHNVYKRNEHKKRLQHSIINLLKNVIRKRANE